VYIGSPGSGEVVNTAKNITNAIKKSNGDATLIFSCVSRSIILTNLQDEMETIRKELKDSSFYAFIYSGGEICPVYDEKRGTVNRYHNYAIIACVLEPSATPLMEIPGNV
jgi:hypothetical protein